MRKATPKIVSKKANAATKVGSGGNTTRRPEEAKVQISAQQAVSGRGNDQVR